MEPKSSHDSLIASSWEPASFLCIKSSLFSVLLVTYKMLVSNVIEYMALLIEK